MYENWFADAYEVTRYGIRNFESLRKESHRFCDNLHRGLEPWLAESLSAQLTTFAKDYWWTKNGDMSVWEGKACCFVMPGAAITYSSFQPLLFFPDLYFETKRRMADFDTGSKRVETGKASSLLAVENKKNEAWMQMLNSSMAQLMEYPRFKKQFEKYKDKTAATAISRSFYSLMLESAVQALRDYMWTGDKDYLEKMWPYVKGGIDADAKRDTNDDGLPDGPVGLNTYDYWAVPMTNCYICTNWLADLKAAARIAELVGDKETAGRYESLSKKGAASFEKLLWNGEYYNLCYDFDKEKADEGCLAEQVAGHLYLRLCGLSPIHQEDHVRTALKSVHKYNRKPEEGLINGSDPKGREDWNYFARFSPRGEDEALAGQWVTPWTGTEYYVSALMLSEGLTQEGLDVIKDVYDRYTRAGMMYNHYECGEHYFRPMSVWANLPALQGLVYDAGEGALKFAPRIRPEDFDTIFILPRAWGRLIQTRNSKKQTDRILVETGKLSLKTITLEAPPEKQENPIAVNASIDAKESPCTWEKTKGEIVIHLKEKKTLAAGQNLTLTISWKA